MKKVLGALVALAMAAGLLIILRGPAVRSGGPVEANSGVGGGQPTDVGMEHSVGYMLRNLGTEPAVLERVRVVGVTGPVEVLGVMARFVPGDRGSFVLLPGFPPPEYPGRPLEEERVVPVSTEFEDNGYPVQGLQLIVGIRATGEGIGRINGIEYTYRVGKKRYRGSSDVYATLCIPLNRFYNPDPAIDKTLQECPPEDARTNFDDRFVEFRVPEDRAS